MFSNRPAAVAKIRGGPLRPQIQGIVLFYAVPGGTWVCAEVTGLPPYQPASGEQGPIGPHGFHLHEYGNCTVGDPKSILLPADTEPHLPAPRQSCRGFSCLVFQSDTQVCLPMLSALTR